VFGLSTLVSSLIGAGLLALASFGGGFYAGHHWESVALANQKVQDAQKVAADAAAALTRLELFVNSLQAASVQYRTQTDALDAKLTSIEKEFADARSQPLPIDCKPDALRVRALSAAIAAVNAAAYPATQP
jgi:hypothetical protein